MEMLSSVDQSGGGRLACWHQGIHSIHDLLAYSTVDEFYQGRGVQMYGPAEANENGRGGPK